MAVDRNRSSYAGRILRVNLDTRDIAAEPLRPEWKRDFIGGKGLAYRYLFDELPARVDPLSPSNVLLVFTGPLSGTIVATTSRIVVVTKSPATGTILDTYAGGGIAAEMKYAGYDGILVKGRASTPVYLLVTDQGVELRDASKVWGLGSLEMDLALGEEIGDPGLRVLSAGPAGENLVPFACLTTESGRQAGRGGAGAVFGSKNLKAIALRGRQGVAVPDMESFLQRYRKIWMEELITEGNLWTWRDGTAGVVKRSNERGILPTRGFTGGVFDAASEIDGEAVKAHLVRNRSCFACPLACRKQTRVNDAEVEGPEYETIALAGSNCGIGDLKSLVAFNRLCDDVGLDTISAGNVVGLAMAITEQGIADLGIHFGDAGTYLQSVHDIASRSGRWAELADGARALARKYGAERLLMEGKGLEYPGYDPRGSQGMALAYATALRGACHMPAFVVGYEGPEGLDPFTLEGKPELVKQLQDLNSAKWSIISCDFAGLSLETLVDLLNAATGETWTMEDFIAVGERVWNLGKLFNLREGFGRVADWPAEALFDQALPSGPAAGKRLSRQEYEDALSAYYSLRGWDYEGRPTTEKLVALGLSDLVV